MKNITKKSLEVFDILSTDYRATVPQYIRELDMCDTSDILEEYRVVFNRLGINIVDNRVQGTSDILESDMIDAVYIFFVQYLVALTENYIGESDIAIIRETLEGIGCKVHSEFNKMSVYAIALNE